MDGLIEDGLGLMVLGMGFVYLFLVALIFATKLMSHTLNRYFPVPEPVLSSGSSKAFVSSFPVDAQLTAVITAAVHQHRSQHSQ